jgi:hypothetical protein
MYIFTRTSGNRIYGSTTVGIFHTHEGVCTLSLSSTLSPTSFNCVHPSCAESGCELTGCVASVRTLSLIKVRSIKKREQHMLWVPLSRDNGTRVFLTSQKLNTKTNKKERKE